LSVFEGIDGNGGRVQVGESLEAVADSRIHGSPSWGVCIRFMLNVMYHVIANELFVLKVFGRRGTVWRWALSRTCRDAYVRAVIDAAQDSASVYRQPNLGLRNDHMLAHLIRKLDT
jgi:hypothetical protein